MRSVSVVISALFLAACPTPPDTGSDAAQPAVDAGGPQYEPLSADESAGLAAALPTATQKTTRAIPESLLSSDDVALENDSFFEILDATGVLLGYGRDVFTPIECTSGACQAIRFVLVFDGAVEFVAVFHPASDSHDWKKYWQGEYLTFDDADRARLREILLHPPADLIAVTSIDDLVTSATSTAPTQIEYQDDVVRGAAFTTYIVLQYMLDSQQTIRQVIA
ncbi:MAG: hypothetical protein JXR83_10025 [Deltaproteobacteria bacterium]|nr:hypothetical protein [Deltaproteobacteria bacterium]